MFKKIAAGYFKQFSSISKIILLVLFCAGLGFIIVWPLWKWATEYPDSYTIVVSAGTAAAIIYAVIRKIQKKTKAELLSGLLKFITIAGGLTVCILLVLAGHRFLTLPVLLLMFILYGIVRYDSGRREKK